MKKTKREKSLTELIIDDLNKELKYELRKQAKITNSPVRRIKVVLKEK